MNLLIKNPKLLIILGLIILILVVTVTTLFSTPSQNSEILPSALPTPLLTNNLPSAFPQTQTAPYPIFVPNSLEKNYQRIANRQPVSQNDEVIKEKLISDASSSGEIYKSSSFSIEYLPAADYFMARILNSNIEQTKNQINNWFLNQGFSQDAICNLPVILYLSPEVRDYLLQNNLQFDPIPKGCQ